MSRTLDVLDPRFKPLAFALLARLTEARIPVLITSTGRTAAEQAIAVATGHSTVTHSKHQDGLAIDIVPFSIWQLHGDDKLQWDTEDPIWIQIRDIVEAVGLRSGARFESALRPLNAIGIGWDAGHAEYVEVDAAHGVPV